MILNRTVRGTQQGEIGTAASKTLGEIPVEGRIFREISWRKGGDEVDEELLSRETDWKAIGGGGKLM